MVPFSFHHPWWVSLFLDPTPNAGWEEGGEGWVGRNGDSCAGSWEFLMGSFKGMRRRDGQTKMIFFFMFLVTSADSASSPAKIINGVAYSVASSLVRRLKTMAIPPRPSSVGRSAVRFEGGYTVETVFDGSKMGIEPYSVEELPGGQLLVLDSMNSNVYRISPPLSIYSQPKLVTGSAEGRTGHVDGKLREARMNQPKGITVDDSGNIYVADTANMAIRKITSSGVTTIAGSRWSRGNHMDGPSEDAKFSNDFDVVYVGSSCSLLVVDRGNQAIREIQLNFDDCAYQYGSGFPLGLSVLLAACFFGYMLALLQNRIRSMISTKNIAVADPRAYAALEPRTFVASPYVKPLKTVRPPLIPLDNEQVRHEEGLPTSTGNHSSKSSMAGMLGLVFSGFRKTPQSDPHHDRPQPNTIPMQESFGIRDEDGPPPPLEEPTPRKTYAFMAKEAERIHHIRQAQAYVKGWHRGPQTHQHIQQHQQYPVGPQTYYEKNYEASNEIVFGAVQELDTKRKMVEIKAVNYGDTIYERYGIRSRTGNMEHSNFY